MLIQNRNQVFPKAQYKNNIVLTVKSFYVKREAVALAIFSSQGPEQWQGLLPQQGVAFQRWGEHSWVSNNRELNVIELNVSEWLVKTTPKFHFCLAFPHAITHHPMCQEGRISMWRSGNPAPPSLPGKPMTSGICHKSISDSLQRHVNGTCKIKVLL